MEYMLYNPEESAGKNQLRIFYKQTGQKLHTNTYMQTLRKIYLPGPKNYSQLSIFNKNEIRCQTKMMVFYLAKLFWVDAAEICNAFFAATMNVHFAAKYNNY